MTGLSIIGTVTAPVGSGRKTILDNNLILSSTTVTNRDLLRVDPETNNVAIFTNSAASTTLDINGTVVVSSQLQVQSNKLVVDSAGRVGINTIPTSSPPADLAIQGDVYFEGSLTVTGTLLSASTTSFDIVNSLLTLNKNGTNTTANGAGITIQRSTTNAELIWDEVRQNFRGGPTSGTSPFIKANGNTDGAAINIGTNDNYTLSLKTNDLNRVTINTTNTSIAGNIAITSGDMLIQGVSVKNGLMPPGTIISFIPGTFGDSTNSSFTLRLGTANTVSSVNAWLAANGYPHWKVCDGQSYTESQSLLYNALGPGANVFNTFLFNTQNFGGGSKFTPNLTNSRFLMGSTTSGQLGGTNTFDHTHDLTNITTTTNALSHSHGTTTTLGFNAQTVNLDTFTGNTLSFDSGTNNGDWGTTSHTHGLDNHTHAADTLWGTYTLGGPTGDCSYFVPSGSFYTPNYWAYAVRTACTINCAAGSYGQSEGTVISGSSGGPSPGTTDTAGSASAAHSHSLNHAHNIPHTHAIPSATSHTHGATSHAHTLSTCAIPSTQFTHSHTTSSTSPTENRPQYMTNFFIVKII